MLNAKVISIDLDKVLFTLFCAYAFSMPFELVLEVLFGIDTIFKPFRILSILIIGVFGIRVLTKGLHLDPRNNTDWLLYGIFTYGIIISLIRIIGGLFNMGLFLNDLFQAGLHLATFFVFKSIPISKKQGLKIFYFFVAGLIVNASYTFIKFLLNFQYGRQAGFTDNPNYVAFGLVAGTTFLLLKTNFKIKFFYRILYLIVILFMIYTFGITGSRTGFVMFLVANVFVLFFASTKRKFSIFILSLVVVLLLLSRQINQSSIGVRVLLLERIDKKLNEGENDVRFTIWSGLFRALEDKGYMGMGIGQFKANFVHYFSDEPNKLILEIVNRGYYLSPHNDYLAILADYGLPSLVLYIAFLFFTVLRIFQRLTYPTEDDDEILLAQFNFTFFVCIIIFGLAAENFQHQLYWFLLMFTTKHYL